jgi:hypothetical protein
MAKESKQEIRDVFQRAVERRQDADVPCCVNEAGEAATPRQIINDLLEKDKILFEKSWLSLSDIDTYTATLVDAIVNAWSPPKNAHQKPGM